MDAEKPHNRCFVSWRTKSSHWHSSIIIQLRKFRIKKTGNITVRAYSFGSIPSWLMVREFKPTLIPQRWTRCLTKGVATGCLNIQRPVNRMLWLKAWLLGALSCEELISLTYSLYHGGLVLPLLTEVYEDWVLNLRLFVTVFIGRPPDTYLLSCFSFLNSHPLLRNIWTCWAIRIKHPEDY